MIHPNNPENQNLLVLFEVNHKGHILKTLDLEEVKDQYKKMLKVNATLNIIESLNPSKNSSSIYFGGETTISIELTLFSRPSSPLSCSVEMRIS